MDNLLKEQSDMLREYLYNLEKKHLTSDQEPFDKLTCRQQLEEAKSFYDMMTAIEARTRVLEADDMYLPEKY